MMPQHRIAGFVLSLSLLSVACGGETSPQLSEARRSPWPGVVDKTLPAIVVLETDKGLGSGFFVRADGTIVTNHHVIKDASHVSVRTSTGEVYRQARVITWDVDRDLAIVRVDAFDAPSVRLGNSNEVKVGSDVLLLGAPRGLEQTASSGIVAAVRVDDSGLRLIQTSAAASPGSSGGPLLNESGEVIGVLSFSLGQSQNLNFAVPINYARGLLDGSAAQGVARETRPTEVVALRTEDSAVGRGAEARPGMMVSVHYTGWLHDPLAPQSRGKRFDSSLDRGAPFEFQLGKGDVIAGWDEGVAGMKVGGTRVLTIPSSLAYGTRGAGTDIPPNTALVFEVQLLGVK